MTSFPFFFLEKVFSRSLRSCKDTLTACVCVCAVFSRTHELITERKFFLLFFFKKERKTLLWRGDTLFTLTWVTCLTVVFIAPCCFYLVQEFQQSLNVHTFRLAACACFLWQLAIFLLAPSLPLGDACASECNDDWKESQQLWEEVLSRKRKQPFKPNVPSFNRQTRAKGRIRTINQLSNKNCEATHVNVIIIHNVSSTYFPKIKWRHVLFSPAFIFCSCFIFKEAWGEAQFPIFDG